MFLSSLVVRLSVRKSLPLSIIYIYMWCQVQQPIWQDCTGRLCVWAGALIPARWLDQWGGIDVVPIMWLNSSALCSPGGSGCWQHMLFYLSELILHSSSSSLAEQCGHVLPMALAVAWLICTVLLHSLHMQLQQLCLQLTHVLAIPLTVIQFQVLPCRYLLCISQCLLIFTVFFHLCIIFGGSFALGI